jgi:hypothetical protein
MPEQGKNTRTPAHRRDARGRERSGATVDGPVHRMCGMARARPKAARLAARLALASFLLVLAAGFASSPAYADILKNPIAVFAALDKVTGRISHLEVPINQTVEFGALKVTPRVCDTRPPTEQPHTASFVEVDEVKLTGEVQRIFTGWMFAESPGLHAVEHPVFDVWLTNCKTNAPPAPSGSSENAAAPGAAPEAPTAAAPAEAPPDAAAPPPPPEPAEAVPEPLPWANPPPPNADSSNR